ncbi:2-octaprenyl-6-methoxyphenyl hydroxylase [Permianibacter sp. IMCC34836]|uniref:2-octaprenyl-6-methoxyphenyl hydroxylase n=1 Tax=Permianibacter fluminis TaxID=2738515 RepID=UPI0015556D27|nr:2-octaprenyl-6-methoxyphenyl hydroxylase [Permianibacter fluminis]NQD35557.1 2-octaprenyl-6-methoxyphenyl hydroxylase [Permianibacter fluminis]
MTDAQNNFDVVIIGGGLTGAALALALTQSPQALRVALLDASPTSANDLPSFDERVLALSEGSRRLLVQLGLWDTLAFEACPIRTIHVSDRGQFGRTVLTASEQQLDALGQVIALRVLGQQFYRALGQRAGVTRLHGKLSAFVQGEDGVQITLQHDGAAQQLQTRVLLGADGGPSGLRAMAALPVDVIDYQQSAVIATVRAERAHQHWAYERFTETGPLALLPMTDNRLSLVWTQTPDEAARLLTLTDAEFLRELQSAFGWRLGKLMQIGAREKFDLRRMRSPVRRQGRMLLMGNAATTLHPIAGQGFNLALRDAMAFADQVRVQQAAGTDWASPAALDAFVGSRQTDADAVAGVTDSLVRLFSNRYPLLRPLRALALSALDALPALKRQVAGGAMGLRR